jgi:tRNA pseudouridine-54 N-methylase
MSTPVEIADLVHRYCDAVVHKDRARWAATWADESTWDLGQGRVTVGKQAIVDYWVEAMQRFDLVVQMAHNGQAIVDQDRGTGSGRWYISEHMHRADGTSGILLAYYDDSYIRVGDAWLFASRAITMLYRGDAGLAGTFIAPG